MYQPILNLATLDANQRAELVRNSALFDEEWYRAQYPDITYHNDGNPDPAYHYANYGFKDCLPSVLFDGPRYLQEQGLSDVNPLLHCLAQGSSTRPYRLNGALEQVLAQQAFGLALTRCERLLLAEHSLNLQGLNVDLTVRPNTLGLQLCIKAALNPTTQPSDLSALLQERGVKSKFIAQPIATIAVNELSSISAAGLNSNAAEVLKWDSLPNSLRLTNSGAPQHQLLMPSRDKHQPSEVLSFVAESEAMARATAQAQPLTAQASRALLIYGPNDPIVNATLEAIKTKGSMSLHQLEFWCAHGQVLCALSHQNQAITVFDDQGKMLPHAMALEPNRFHPVNTAHEPIKRFAELAAEALKVAGEADFMAVTYQIVPQADVHIISHLSTLPWGGQFDFTQGFALQLCQRAQLAL